MQLIVAIEPRSYRQVIGQAIRALRPHVKVTILEPDTLGAGVRRLEPELVFAGLPDTFGASGGGHGKVGVGGVSSLRTPTGEGLPGREALGAGGGRALRPPLGGGRGRRVRPDGERLAELSNYPSSYSYSPNAR